MKLLAFLLGAAFFLHAADTLTVFNQQWTVVNASDWKVSGEGAAQTLELNTHRGPLPGPRRPIQFAIAETAPFTRVTVAVEARARTRSLMMVFAYQDAAHFNYAHLSTDTGTKQPVHNGVFHVFGGERVRISSPEGPAAFAAIDRWYKVKLQWDGTKGTVSVEVDGHPVPALQAVDVSLKSGKIGLGSFDEVGDFRNLKITGQ